MYDIPRESAEWIYPQVFETDLVTNATETMTEGVEFSIVPANERAATWVPAVVRDGKTAILISGLEPGSYRVFSRTTNDPPAAPVRDDIFFRIT